MSCPLRQGMWAPRAHPTSESVKNLQHKTNTHLTLVFLHFKGFFLHFLICSLQLLT